MEQTLAGRVALVTGAAHGIGQACAVALAERGAAVAVADIDPAGEATARQVTAAGGTSLFVATDVSDPDGVRAMADRVHGSFGRVDILVNDAAIFPRTSIADLAFDEWQRVLAVNLSGPFLCTKAFLPGMIERRWGRVINVASGLGVTGGVKAAAYSTSKGGLIAFTKSLAREVALHGVTANVIVPGLADTRMPRQGGQTQEEIDAMVAQIPLRRLAQPREVAEYLAFIVGPSCDYVTGQTLFVNGGWLMP